MFFKKLSGHHRSELIYYGEMSGDLGCVCGDAMLLLRRVIVVPSVDAGSVLGTSFSGMFKSGTGFDCSCILHRLESSVVQNFLCSIFFSDLERVLHILQ